MNFLALAGILSAIAMYAVAVYVRHAKTAEAVASLASIGQESVTFYDQSDAMQPAGTTPEAAHAMRHFPPSSVHSVPARLEDVRGKRYQSAFADWNVSPWRELRFTISLPQYYAYSYESSGSGSTAKATATAHGDLDGDGNSSTFRITITPDANFHAKVGPLEKQDPEE